MKTIIKEEKYVEGVPVLDIYPDLSGVVDTFVHSTKEMEHGLEHNYAQAGHFYNEEPAPDNGKQEVKQETVPVEMEKLAKLKGMDGTVIYPDVSGLVDTFVHTDKEMEHGLEHNYAQGGHFYNEECAPDNDMCEIVEKEKERP